VRRIPQTILALRAADCPRLRAAGDVRRYQVWFRDAAAFCTASTFNLSNGLEASWSP